METIEHLKGSKQISIQGGFCSKVATKMTEINQWTSVGTNNFSMVRRGKFFLQRDRKWISLGRAILHLYIHPSFEEADGFRPSKGIVGIACIKLSTFNATRERKKVSKGEGPFSRRRPFYAFSLGGYLSIIEKSATFVSIVKHWTRMRRGSFHSI